MRGGIVKESLEVEMGASRAAMLIMAGTSSIRRLGEKKAYREE
jgi:hypothetical protein